MKTLLLLLFPLALLAQTSQPLTYRASDGVLSPSNALGANVLAGANVTVTKGQNGRLTIAAASGGIDAVNSNRLVRAEETNAAQTALWLVIAARAQEAEVTNATQQVALIELTNLNNAALAYTLAVSNISYTASNALWSLNAAASNALGSRFTNYVPVLNGTATNFSVSRFTGSTNSPLVIRDTNGAPVGEWNTNGALLVGSNSSNGLVVSNNNGVVTLTESNSASARITLGNNAIGIGTDPNSNYKVYLAGGGSAVGWDVTSGNIILRGGASSKFYVNGWGYISWPVVDGNMIIGRDAGGFGNLTGVSNILASSCITATNGFSTPTNPFPAWATNGIATQWNSNGTLFQITSRRAGTNQSISFIAVEP